MFMAIPDYASAMAWELYTNSSSNTTSAPVDPSQVFVRFLFHNGTTVNDAELVSYPLFGGSSTEIGWNEFVQSMGKFSVGTTQQWCQVCGNTTGSCAQYAPGSAGASGGGGQQSASGGKSSGSGGGLSNAVAGVIGAMVTLGVILAVEALILLVSGLRLVRRGPGGGGAAQNGVANGAKA